MVSLNTKISEKGEWLPFLGYSSIMKISNFQKFDYVFKEIESEPEFSAIKLLPKQSLHMTLFNIWCYNQKCIDCLLPYINEFEFIFFTRNNLLLPTNYLKKEHSIVKKIIEDEYKTLDVTPTRVKVILNDNVLKCNLFFDEKTTKILNELHTKIGKVYNKNDTFIPHCTLGYVYKPYEKSVKLINKLKILETYFNSKLGMFKLSDLSVYCFKNMGEFDDYLPMME